MSRRDPAQRVGAMEAVGDLVGAPGRARRSSRRRRRSRSGGRDRARSVAVAGRQGSTRTPHGRSSPGIAIAISADADRRRRRTRRSRRPRRARDRRRPPDRPPRPARRTSAAGPAGGWSGRRARGTKPLAAELVDRGRPEPAALADDSDRLAEDLVERLGVGGDPAERRDGGEVGPAAEAIAVGRGGRTVGGRSCGGRSGAAELTGRRGLRARPGSGAFSAAARKRWRSPSR